MKPDQDISDEFLFLQLQSGSVKAFDFIFRKYYKSLCIHAYRIVSEHSDAESVVQDCFIKFWKTRKEIKSIENISSYLFAMVRNTSIDHLRKRRKLQLVPIEHNELFDNKTDEDVKLRELNAHLWSAIAHLPARCRIAFEYSRIDGFTYPQIAEKMDISVKAVEALIGRSLKILRIDLVDFLSLIFVIINLY